MPAGRKEKENYTFRGLTVLVIGPGAATPINHIGKTPLARAGIVGQFGQRCILLLLVINKKYFSTLYKREQT